MVGLYPLVEPRDVRDDRDAVADLLAARVPWIQLRGGTARELLAAASALISPARDAGTVLIVNDRADVARAAGTGVHVGQDDLPPAACRVLLGTKACIGFSTHEEGEVEAAAADSAIDYLAFGPVFATGSKPDARPTVGLDRLRAMVGIVRARRPGLPVVAIGGIDADRAAEVLAAGVDAVAAIAAIRGADGRLDRSRIAAMIAVCRRAA